MTGGRTASIEGTRNTRGAPLACHDPARHTSLARPIASAGVSDSARRDTPEHRGDGSPAAIERALTLALRRASAAYDSRSRWETRVRAALSALLDLFDEQPDIARLCVLQSENAGPAVLALRDKTLAVLARRIDDGCHSARRQPPPHAAQAVLAGTIGAIRGRLLESDQATVSDLLDPLMSFIVLPYRGAAASRGELTGPSPPSAA